MSAPTHQLVLQFREDAFPDFDALIQFGDTLTEALGSQHEVDGHDIGSGEVNFFIFTADPHAALAQIRDATGQTLDRTGGRAAARTLEGEDYKVLWPEGDARPFRIN
jgi:hypothetical protein